MKRTELCHYLQEAIKDRENSLKSWNQKALSRDRKLKDNQVSIPVRLDLAREILAYLSTKSSGKRKDRDKEKST